MSFNDNAANMTGGGANVNHPGGKKVDDNSTANRYSEKAGPVASDSLAAESSTFQSANRSAEPLSVKGSNSTLANTNISGAVTLEPTDVASSRPENRGEYPDETARMGNFSKNDNQNHQHANDGSLHDNANPAPTYVDPVSQGSGLSAEFGKVHGKNLKEISKDEKFDGEGKQPKGGKDAREDEDRVAVSKMQQQNAVRDTAGSGVNANTKGQQGSQYDALNSEENA